MKKNKILHIITSLGSGGTEGVLSRLVISDRDRNEHIVISLKKDGRYQSVLSDNNIVVYSLNFQKKIGSIFEFIKLLKIVAREKPVLIQTWLYHADFIGALVAKLLGIKNLAWGIRTSKITVDISNSLVLRLLWVLARMSPFLPTKIACCSVTAMNEHIQIGYDANKFTIIHNGYDSDKFYFKPQGRVKLRSAWGLGISDIAVGCIARWDPFKDHNNLFQALALLKNGESMRCILMGDSMHAGNPALMKLIANYGLGEQIIFVSNQLDVAEVMSALDFLILPSVSEGFPNVVAEAMLCELPVISTDVGESRLIVDACGYIVPPSDPLSLANAINSAVALVGSPEYMELKLRSRKRIIEKFPLRRMMTEFQEFWSAIINSNLR